MPKKRVGICFGEVPATAFVSLLRPQPSSGGTKTAPSEGKTEDLHEEDLYSEQSAYFSKVAGHTDTEVPSAPSHEPLVDINEEEAKRRLRGEWRPDPFAEIEAMLTPDLGLEVPCSIIVPTYEGSTDQDTTDEEIEGEEKAYPAISERKPHGAPDDYSGEYYDTRELIRNLRIGNEQSLNVTLDFLLDSDWSNEDVAYGITDSGGVETLLNIIDINNVTTQISALKVILKMLDSSTMRGILINQGVPLFCFKMLAHPSPEILQVTSEILVKLSDEKAMRLVARKSFGLEVMLELAQLPAGSYESAEDAGMFENERMRVNAGLNCLRALSKLHGSHKVRSALYRIGMSTFLKRILASPIPEISKMSHKILGQAASVIEYKQIFIFDRFIDYIYKKYKKKDPDLFVPMLRIIIKILDYPPTRQWLLKNGLFRRLVNDMPKQQLIPLMLTLQGLAKLCNTEKHRRIVNGAAMIPSLILLLSHHDPRTRDFAGALLCQLSRYPENAEEICGPQNLTLMKLMDIIRDSDDDNVVAHCCKILGDMFQDERIFWDVLDVLDPIERLFPCILSSDPKVIEHGCSAMAPFVGPIPNSHEAMRQADDAFYYLMQLLDHPDDGAKGGALTLMSKICNDEMNRETLEDMGLIAKVLELAQTAKHPRLRYGLGLVFGSLASSAKNSFYLGKRGVLDILVDWLNKDTSKFAQLGIVSGLWKLSYEPINCMVIIKHKIVDRLLEVMTGDAECLQNSCAGLLMNMRYLARAAEWRNNVGQQHPPEECIGTASDPDLFVPFQYPDDDPYIA